MKTLENIRLAYTAKCLENNRLRLLLNDRDNKIIFRDMELEKLIRQVTQLEKENKELKKLGEQK